MIEFTLVEELLVSVLLLLYLIGGGGIGYYLGFIKGLKEGKKIYYRRP